MFASVAKLCSRYSDPPDECLRSPDSRSRADEPEVESEASRVCRDGRGQVRLQGLTTRDNEASARHGRDPAARAKRRSPFGEMTSKPSSSGSMALHRPLRRAFHPLSPRFFRSACGRVSKTSHHLTPFFTPTLWIVRGAEAAGGSPASPSGQSRARSGDPRPRARPSSPTPTGPRRHWGAQDASRRRAHAFSNVPCAPRG